jgi:hypothetical protein
MKHVHFMLLLMPHLVHLVLCPSCLRALFCIVQGSTAVWAPCLGAHMSYMQWYSGPCTCCYRTTGSHVECSLLEGHTAQRYKLLMFVSVDRPRCMLLSNAVQVQQEGSSMSQVHCMLCCGIRCDLPCVHPACVHDVVVCAAFLGAHMLLCMHRVPVACTCCCSSHVDGSLLEGHTAQRCNLRM